jgi:signal transduction histidine kinase
LGINMSAHSGSFRWSVGTRAAGHAPLADTILEQPQQRPTGAFTTPASQPVRQFDALRLKDEILAMVAHELRGPLSPLQLAAQLIRRASADRPEVLRSVGKSRTLCACPRI